MLAAAATIGGALTGGVAVLKGWLEARKARADAVVEEERTESTRLERARKAEDAEDKCARELRAANARIEVLETQQGKNTEKLRLLELAAPRGWVMERLFQAGDTFEKIFDQGVDGFALSSSAAMGTLLWVSRSMCEWLGAPREEILRAGWRSLINPCDLEDAERSEAKAWHDPLTGEVFRYRVLGGAHAGSWAILRWFSFNYDQQGVTFSLIRFEGYAEAS